MSTAFPLTPWSSILRGEELGDDARRDILRRLLARYWQPLYRCVRFGWNLEPSEATRRLEEFFFALLHTDMLRGLDPEKGRFREFLKRRLEEFMATADETARGEAPRETGIADLSEAAAVEAPQDERSPGGEPGEVFDSSWVELLIERALGRYAEEAADEPEDGPFAVFRGIDLETQRDPERRRSELAAELKLSEEQLNERLHEARKHFRRVMAEQIHDYALDDSDAREELRWTIG